MIYMLNILEGYTGELAVNCSLTDSLTACAFGNIVGVILRAGTVCSDYGGIDVGIEGFDDV